MSNVFVWILMSIHFSETTHFLISCFNTNNQILSPLNKHGNILENSEKEKKNTKKKDIVVASQPYLCKQL